MKNVYYEEIIEETVSHYYMFLPTDEDRMEGRNSVKISRHYILITDTMDSVSCIAFC